MNFKAFENRICLSTPTMHGEEMSFVKEAFDRNWIAPLGFNCDNFETEMNILHRLSKDRVIKIILIQIL